MASKICVKCYVNKSLSAFGRGKGKHQNDPHGRTDCKVCNNESSKLCREKAAQMHALMTELPDLPAEQPVIMHDTDEDEALIHALLVD